MLVGSLHHDHDHYHWLHHHHLHQHHHDHCHHQLSMVLVGGLQLALSTLGLIGNTLSIVLLSRYLIIKMAMYGNKALSIVLLSRSTGPPSQLVPHSTGPPSQLIPPVNWSPIQLVLRVN